MENDTGIGTGEGGGSEGKADASGDVGSGDASSPVQSQIADMLGTFLDDKASDKEFEDVTKGVDEATDEAGKDAGEEGKDTPAVEEPAEKDKAEAKPDGEGKEATDDTRDSQIANLTEQVAALSQQISALLNSQAKPKEEPKRDTIDDDFEEVKKDLVSEFVNSDEEYDQAFDKREKMNEILKRVQESSVQGVLRAIPKIINKVVPQYVQMYQKTIDFYNKHPDLKPHAQFVGQVTNDIVSKNPDWDMDKVFAALGGDDKDVGEVRKRLGLKKSAETAAKKYNVARPAFGKAQSARQGVDAAAKLTGVEKEIADMLSTEEL